MNIPEINTLSSCQVNSLEYEVYDDSLQYPEQWDWDKAEYRDGRFDGFLLSLQPWYCRLWFWTRKLLGILIGKEKW